MANVSRARRRINPVFLGKPPGLIGGLGSVLSEIVLTWVGGTNGVLAEDQDSVLPLEIATIDAGDADSITLLSDPDSKFSITDNGDGTASLFLNATVAYATATSHSFTIEASLDGSSVYYADFLFISEVVAATAPSAITLEWDPGFAAGNIVDDEDTTLPLRLGLLRCSGTSPITWSEFSDPDSKFTITDQGNGTAIVYLSAAVSNDLDGTHPFTVEASNAHGDATQAFTLNVLANTNDSGIDPATTPVSTSPDLVGEFKVKSGGGGTKVSGKNSATVKFLLDLGDPQAAYSYTVQYDPDFSGLSQQGKLAFIGFGFKEGNNFHFVGLKGDGSTGLNTYQIHGTNFSSNSTAPTMVDGGVAAHGTQAGPNWLRLVVSSDGLTYSMYSSSDGISWTLEYTAQAPTPLADAVGVMEFGVAGYIDGADKGSFSVMINAWSEGLVPSNTVAPSISVAA